MSELLTYIGEGGLGAGLLFVIWKYAFPFIRGLYKELLKLREEVTELKVKVASQEVELKQTKEQLEYFKTKYMDKVVLKSHGKKRNYEE